MPPEPHDLVLLDPPYHAGWLDRLLGPRCRAGLGRRAGFTLNANSRWTAERLAACGGEGLAVIRAARAGQVHYHLLGPKESTAPCGPQQNGEA